MQRLKQILIYVYMVFMLISCSNKPPEIVEIERSESVYRIEKHEGWSEEYQAYYDEIGGLVKEQHFIILNHPRKRSELIKLINDYNKNTITKDTLLKYDRSFIRTFYKKDRETMEVYDMGKSNANLEDYDSIEKFEKNIRSQIFNQLDYCRKAELVKIYWKIDSRQNTEIVYYIYGNRETIDNVPDEELFDLK